ncbi:hypothetical protein ACYPJF_06935 [Stenotrophomonas geniculata]
MSDMTIERKVNGMPLLVPAGAEAIQALEMAQTFVEQVQSLMWDAMREAAASDDAMTVKFDYDRVVVMERLLSMSTAMYQASGAVA